MREGKYWLEGRSEVPTWILDEAAVECPAVLPTLCSLILFINSGEPRPSVRQLARDTRKSTVTVRRHLREMKRRGMITVTAQSYDDDPIAQGPNLYTFVVTKDG